MFPIIKIRHCEFDKKSDGQHQAQSWEHHSIHHSLDLAGGIRPGLLYGVRHVAGGGGEGWDHAQGGHRQGQEQHLDSLFSDTHSDTSIKLEGRPTGAALLTIVCWNQ